MESLPNGKSGTVSLSVEAITHNKLIVGVDWSFPHRSGIVETLHIVGLVEAGGGERRGVSGKHETR